VRDARRWSRLAKDDRISSGDGSLLDADAGERSDDVLFVKHLMLMAMDGNGDCGVVVMAVAMGVFANEFRQVRHGQCLDRDGATLRNCWTAAL